jgi:serine/threonine protein kinase
MSADTPADRHPVEALAEEFAARWRRGERPSVDEYAARHPELADDIRSLFPTLMLLEQAAPAGPPTRLGEFRVGREIGRGGMGVVYEAEQEPLGRRVALKVLPPETLPDPVRRERFRREARAAARLHHTNIVPVFAVGEQEGRLYFAMQYIEGRGLDEVLADLRRRRGPTPGSTATGTPTDLTGDGSGHYRAAARVALQSAEALAHAHAQGVLHRDVKPSNLLLDAQGSVWVTDFGLAKIEGGDDLTATGNVVGTLRYLAPERFQGRADARGDVYSLGLVLYELLTLRPAFDAEERSVLVEQVLRAEPTPPRRLRRDLPHDLETICLQCLQKEPARRYDTAQELADDLRRFLAGEPIRARPSGPSRRGCC